MSLVCQILYPHAHATRALAHLVKKMGCRIHLCTVDISINICVRYEASHEKLTSWLDARKCPKTDNSDAVEMDQEAAVGSLLDWQPITVHVPARHPSALIILLCLLRVLLGGGVEQNPLSGQLWAEVNFCIIPLPEPGGHSQIYQWDPWVWCYWFFPFSENIPDRVIDSPRFVWLVTCQSCMTLFFQG